MTEKTMSVFFFFHEGPRTYAVCQVQGRHDFWNRDKKIVRPGTLLPAIHNSIVSPEDSVDAMPRAAREQLGDKFMYRLTDLWSKRQVIHGIQGKQWQGLLFSFEDFRDISLPASSGGLAILAIEEIESLRDAGQFPEDKPLCADCEAMEWNDMQALRTGWMQLSPRRR